MKQWFSDLAAWFGNLGEWFNDNLLVYVGEFWARASKYKLFWVFSVGWAGMRFASGLAVKVYNHFVSFNTQARDALGAISSGGSVGSLLDKANSVVPVAEAMVLAATLGGLWLSALTIRWALSMWKAVPFKAS